MNSERFELTDYELVDVKLQHYTGKLDENRPDIMHLIREVRKAQVGKVFSMLEPVELEALGDDELWQVITETWNSNSQADDPDLLRARAISQATVLKNQKGQLFRVKEEE